MHSRTLTRLCVTYMWIHFLGIRVNKNHKFCSWCISQFVTPLSARRKKPWPCRDEIYRNQTNKEILKILRGCILPNSSITRPFVHAIYHQNLLVLYSLLLPDTQLVTYIYHSPFYLKRRLPLLTCQFQRQSGNQPHPSHRSPHEENFSRINVLLFSHGLP